MSRILKLYGVILAVVIGCNSSNELDPAKTADSGGTTGGGLENLLTVPAICADECFSQNSATCVKDSKNQCVECTTELHCRENPFAKGGLCRASVKTCYCEKNSDCSTNRRGKICNQSVKQCSCQSDGDCADLAGTKCLAEVQGVGKSCKVPCTGDQDCKAYKQTPACNIKSGQCVPCTQDANCTSDPLRLKCNPATFRCVQCLSSLDCKANPFSFGALCESNICKCKSKGDCASSNVGKSCDKYSQCVCANNSECTHAPITKCLKIAPSSSTMQCQKPCGGNRDCSKEAPLCNTQTGQCVQCRNANDCVAPSRPFCSAETGRCVGCRNDTDCANQTGPWAALKHCHEELGTCRECTTSKHCEDVGKSFCNSIGTCKECETNDHCRGNAMLKAKGPVCDTEYFVCTCEGSDQCTSKNCAYDGGITPDSPDFAAMQPLFKHCQTN